MKRFFILFIAGLLAPVGLLAADADSVLLQRVENFSRFAKAFPQERVYVHFDNTSYYKGEQIWYKAYVVRDENLHPTNLSRILYVELLNPIGYPVETQKLVIDKGQAHGSFVLKDTLNAGFYEVRAYTSWMLNFTTGDAHGWDRLRRSEARRHYGERFQRYLQGNAGVFSRVFPIYEKVDSGRYAQRRMARLPKATASLVDPVKDKLEIDFYPEGGNLVRGVPTRVAFQAHNAEGRTLNVAGALYRRGDSIGYFRTDYAGRGVFSVTADSLDTEELTDGLQLRLTYNSHNYRFSLPKARKRGYSLSVFSAGGQLKAMVARNNRTDGLPLGLSITSRGRVYYYNMLDLTASERAVALVDEHSLPTGVNVVTLFTQEGQVLAQRLVFVNNHDLAGLTLKNIGAEASQLTPYQKVSLDYQLTDTAGRPVRTSVPFSIAVTDGPTREETYDDYTILSYLLLGSEVKGFIPHPEYYFEADDNEHRAALDQLLMVQGWTRYDYEQMMSGRQWEPMLAIERGLNFSGRLWDDNDYESKRFWKLQTNKPYWVYSEMYIDGDTVPTDHSLDFWMYATTRDDQHGKAPQIILTGETKVDSSGTFRLNMAPFYGKGRIALMLNKKSIKELGVEGGGVHAHNFRWNTVKRPGFLLSKRVEPLNQYSPLPKNYDYYETAALSDPIDRQMFRYGFMAVPKENRSRIIFYDPKSQTYMLPEVQKKKRRRWSDFSEVTPVCVMDVKDMMAWLSNIYGDISDFKLRENSPYSGGPVDGGYDIMHQMMMDDARWMDEQFGTKDYTKQMERMIYNEKSHTQYELDASAHYARMAELLYIFGLDGMNSTYVGVNEAGDIPHFTSATGSAENLPLNMHFFPVNENFRELQLYADIDNRKLTHQQGNYHETVFSYNPYRTTNESHPLTSIFNFTIGDEYSNDHPLPDFMGFRINFQGFTRPAEFFVPDYDWEPEPEETDYRRTVYWNPQATTDSQGRAHIEFFNNGFSKKLAVSAQGITSGGQTIGAASQLNEK